MKLVRSSVSGVIEVSRLPRTARNLHLNPDIEPGILPLFRFFTLLAWLVLSPSLLSLLIPRTPDKLPNYLGIFCWVQYSLLWIYLTRQWLHGLLSKCYLPIALGLNGFAPVVIQILAAQLRLDQGVPVAEALQPSPNSLYVWLLLPLLLVAMQYGYWALLGFTM
jgi:hypothetical protein